MERDMPAQKYFPGLRRGSLTLLSLGYRETLSGNRLRVATVRCDCGEEFTKNAKRFLYPRDEGLQMCDKCMREYYANKSDRSKRRVTVQVFTPTLDIRVGSTSGYTKTQLVEIGDKLAEYAETLVT